MKEIPKEVSEYFKKIGSKGGSAGKGESKIRTRTPEQMQAMRDSKKKKGGIV